MNDHVIVDAADAIEIAEALQWLRDWFASDPTTLAESMHRFSLGMITLDQLSADLDGFAVTLEQQS